MGPELLELLRQTYVFRHLPQGELSRLAGGFSEQEFHAGESLVRRGVAEDGWRIIQSGKARVLDGDPSAPSLPPVIGRGDSFGDSSLIEAGMWLYSIRADSVVRVFTLTRAAFELFARELSVGSRAALVHRIHQNREFEFLKRLRLFGHLNIDGLEELLDSVPRISHVRGDYLFREDDPSDSCYVVRRGRVHLLKLVGQAQKQLAVRREGNLIGETELLYRTPRIAGAVASTDVELLVFSRDLLDRYLPEGAARETIFHLATERLLQYQNMLSDAEAPSDATRLPNLTVQHVRVPGHRLSRTYPIVRTETATLGGLACLAMIDAFHKRESLWQDRLETLAGDRRPSTLLTFSRSAEDCGYFTRLVKPRANELRVAHLPAIIEDDDGSLAVLFSKDHQHAVVGNPTRGVRAVASDEFHRTWSGALLTLDIPVPQSQALPVRRHTRALISITVASLVVLLFGLAGPLASKAIVDRVLVNGDLTLLELLLVAVIAVVTFQLLAAVLRDYLLAHTNYRATLSLQQRFLHHVLHLPQSAIVTRPVADLAVRFRENELLVQRASKTGLTIAVDSCAVTAYFAALWLISHPAAFIAAGFVASYVAVTLASAPLARRVGRRSGEARSTLQAHLIEAVSGMQTIKSLLVESLFFERGRKLMTRVKEADFAASQLTFNLELIGSALHLAAVVAIFGYGARLASAGHATTGDMVASLGIFGATLAPLSGLLDVRNGVRGVRGSMVALKEVSDLETELPSAAGAPPPIEGHVAFSHVSFRYPGQIDDVLSDITLEVLPGQRVAVVGRSGSGKTTLVSLLMGLYPPTSGNLYLDHVDIQSIPSVALRRQLGVVEQQPFLFDGTIRENIAKADPSIPLEQVQIAARIAGIHDFIAALPGGYDTIVGERGAVLSGGEKQRLMIARALVGKPRLLILDEATSAVDSGSESVIQRNIVEAAAGRTTFMIAHRLSTVRHADLIVVLDHGHVVETGTHAQLMSARSLYYYLNTRTV